MGVRGGIDLGGTKIQAAVVDDKGSVLGDARHPTPREGGAPEIAAAMAVALRDAAERAGFEPGALSGVGVGSPGDVDGVAGTVAHARNLPGWEGVFPMAAALEEQLGVPASLGNDVQVAVNAEAALGAGRPFRSLLGVFWGTGVGGGIILDAKPWIGRRAAGEVGHMVVKMDGARCSCGRRGCMEAYAGRGAMEAQARHEAGKGHKTDLFKIMEQRGRDRLTSGIWERALEAGDQMAMDLMDRAVAALGAGIASAVNLLDVEAVIVGGGMGSRFGQPMADRIAEAMLPHLFVDDEPPAVVVAELGDLGGAIGASLLVPSGQSPAL
jgi:glucokinase